MDVTARLRTLPLLLRPRAGRAVRERKTSSSVAWCVFSEVSSPPARVTGSA